MLPHIGDTEIVSICIYLPYLSCYKYTDKKGECTPYIQQKLHLPKRCFRDPVLNKCLVLVRYQTGPFTIL